MRARGARTARKRSSAIAPHEMVLSIAAGLALVLGLASILVGLPVGLLDLGFLAALIVDILGGSLLLLSILVFRRTVLGGFLLAFSSSLVLLGFGRFAGVLGGTFGLVGALYGLLVLGGGRSRIRLTPSRGFLGRPGQRRPPG